VNPAPSDPDRPLRICLISYRSNPHSGGQGVYIRHLSQALNNLGHEVEVVSGPPPMPLDDGIRIRHLPGLDLYNAENPFRMPTFRELADPINLIEWLGVSTGGFPEPFTFGLRAYRFLRPKWHQYDVVHDNQSLSYGIWALAKFIPTVATIHHPITVDRMLAVRAAVVPHQKMIRHRWHSFIGMQKRVSRSLSHIITVSQCARRDIQNDFKIPSERFRVVPNGIGTDQFYPSRGIGREKNRLIVTTSADTPLKGLHYLLQALARIAATHNVRLTVVGTPKADGHILRLTRRLGLSSRVTFTGPIDQQEFFRQYAKASVAVVPSLYEGFGLPAGEAMACGVPVVSTRGGALPEVVGDAGVLVPPADPAALAAAIVDLLDHPAKARALGQAGCRRVRKHFSWTVAAAKTVAVYREAIGAYGRL